MSLCVCRTDAAWCSPRANRHLHRNPQVWAPRGTLDSLHGAAGAASRGTSSPHMVLAAQGRPAVPRIPELLQDTWDVCSAAALTIASSMGREPLQTCGTSLSLRKWAGTDGGREGRDMPRGVWSSLASPSPAAGPERHLLAAGPALCLEEHACPNETRAVGRSQASWPDHTVRALMSPNNAAHLLMSTWWLKPWKECSHLTGMTCSHSLVLVKMSKQVGVWEGGHFSLSDEMPCAKPDESV